MLETKERIMLFFSSLFMFVGITCAPILCAAPWDGHIFLYICSSIFLCAVYTLAVTAMHVTLEVSIGFPAIACLICTRYATGTLHLDNVYGLGVLLSYVFTIVCIALVVGNYTQVQVLYFAVVYVAIGVACLPIAIICARRGYPHTESCNKLWINSDIEHDLIGDLMHRLHGQHLVVDPVVATLAGHMQNSNPQKAVVLSFHGSTGIGKNFISTIVADHIYKKGHQSKFFHTMIGPHHFPDQQLIETYQADLQSWIRGNISLCERSLFVLDEVDKMPPGLLDTLVPFMEYYPNVDDVDYRKSIFILISNTGADAINQHTYEHWQKGGRREELTLKKMEHIVHRSTYSETGGLWKSVILEKSLVTAFLPFLPLEEEHVLKCIRDDIEAKGYDIHAASFDKHLIERVNSELMYWPEGTHKFSVAGCKRVSDKVDAIVYDNQLPIRHDFGKTKKSTEKHEL